MDKGIIKISADIDANDHWGYTFNFVEISCTECGYSIVLFEDDDVK